MTDAFSAVLSAGNPFSAERVVRIGPPAPDVAAIHASPFRQLLDLAGRVRVENVALGVTLWGEPGVGKSHLLRRLERWCATDDHALYASPFAVQVPAAELPRSILRDLLSAATACAPGRWHESALFHVVERFVTEAVPADQRTAADLARPRECIGRAVAGLAKLVPGISEDDPIVRAIFRFAQTAAAARAGRGEVGGATLALRWLSGDELSADEAETLGLHARDGKLTDAQVIRAVAILAQLARVAGQPLILAFDQIHTLRIEHVAALTRFLHELLDSVANLLIVLSEVQDELIRLKENHTISPAAWDRIGQHHVDLSRLGRADMRRLVEARLRTFVDLIDDPAVRAAATHDSLFPLGSDWWHEVFGGRDEASARRVLQLANEHWRKLQPDPAAPTGSLFPPEEPTIDQIIDTAMAQRMAATANKLPPNIDHIAGLAHALLEQCLDRPLPCRVERLDFPPSLPKQISYRGRVHLILGGRPARAGLAGIVATSATAVTALLRRLTMAGDRPERIVLVTDARRGLALGRDAAAEGRRHFNELQALGAGRFLRIELTQEQYAELEALDFVVRRAADLEIPGGTRAQKQAAVIESHHRCKRYSRHPLLCWLLSDSTPGAADAVQSE